AVVAFLATASIGAIWSSCAPEFGAAAVVDRFAQIEPRVLLAVSGYQYGGKRVSRVDQLHAIAEALPSLAAVVHIPYPDEHGGEIGGRPTLGWDELVSQRADLPLQRGGFEPPLYTLSSSATTGRPKAIVHGHGGILVEHLKMLALHLDLGERDRFMWYTTTGWMMWNYLVSGLLVGATIVAFDGDPGYPDLDVLWALAAELGITHLGLSATFLANCRRAGLRPGSKYDLTRIRHLGSTGSPLPLECYGWV